MNSVVRQLLEQNTDVVMVDTGDSYEGICRYFKGTYITYSKEKPISMNPFKITDTEYAQNFGEKKNFLKSLIFLIFKGSEAPTKICSLRTRRTAPTRSTAGNWKRNINILNMIMKQTSPPPKHPKIHLPLADRILNTILSILLMAVVWPMMILYILLRRRKPTHESSGR